MSEATPCVRTGSFEATVNRITPVPRPELPEVSVTQDASSCAVQKRSSWVVKRTANVPPALGTFTTGWDTAAP